MTPTEGPLVRTIPPDIVQRILGTKRQGQKLMRLKTGAKFTGKKIHLFFQGLKVPTVLTHLPSRFSSNGFKFDPKFFQKFFQLQTPEKSFFVIPENNRGRISL